MSEILLYKTDNDEIKLEVRIQNETIWLNQKQNMGVNHGK